MEGIDSMGTFREQGIALKTHATRRSKRELSRVVRPGIEDGGPTVNG